MPSCAGLAPHHDDVEIWVLQTEGSKRWSIYRPAEGPHANCLLANQCSGDLVEAELGPPLMEFIMEVGVCGCVVHVLVGWWRIYCGRH